MLLTVLLLIAVLPLSALVLHKRPAEFLKSRILLLVFFGLILRFAASFIPFTYVSDLEYFVMWSEKVQSLGLGRVYGPGGYVDYPPGYLYVLGILGHLKGLLGTADISEVFRLYKVPAMICDVMIALCVYKSALKFRGEKFAAFALAFVLFNPALIVNSAVWGQVDSVLCLVLLISLTMLSEGRTFAASFVFIAAALIKPQALIAAPVYVYHFTVFIKNGGLKAFRQLALCGLGCLAAFTLGFLPMSFPDGTFNMIPGFIQYVRTLGSYNYYSVNAYNIYTLIGLNWKDLPEGGLHGIINTAVIVLISLAALFYLSKKREKGAYLNAAAFLYFAMFMLSFKMHERYTFPSVVFTFAAFILEGSKRRLAGHIALSLLFTINCLDVIRLIALGNYLNDIAVSGPLISLFYVLCFGWFAYSMAKEQL